MAGARGARRDVRAGARPAQRAARADPLGPRLARLAGGWDARAGAARRSRCASCARAAVELLAEPFAERARALGLERRARRFATARGHAPPTRRSSCASSPSASRATSSAASPATARTATSSLLQRDGRELRAYGSQGEQRLALLALLLAEREVIAEQRGEPPLMLLDDVMSELDARAPRAARRRAARAGARA